VRSEMDQATVTRVDPDAAFKASERLGLHVRR
jgi:hypothetical protein